MIFEIYSKILTDHGFIDIKEKLNEKGYKLAYVNREGKLSFTDEYRITRVCPEDVLKYSDKLFIGTISSQDALYFQDDLYNKVRLEDIKTDENNVKNIVSCFNCFKNVDEDYINIKLNVNDKDITISYKNFLKILILTMCFSSANPKEDTSHSIKLYIKGETMLNYVVSMLNDILGENFGGIVKKGTSTVYINCSKLYYIFVRIEEILHSIMISDSLSKTFCDALNDVSRELHFFDATYPHYNIILGKSLNKYIHYIAAFLSVNGYKMYFRRMPNREYKLMFDKKTKHNFVGEFESVYNKAHYYYYDVHMFENKPIFVLETHDWISNTSLRATKNDLGEVMSIELEELRKKEELDKSLNNTPFDPFDLSDVFNIGR